MGASGADTDRDAGIGLVEVVITMFLLALIAMAFLPFLLNSYRAAATNGDRATANQAVSDMMERLRTELAASDQDCAWVEHWTTSREGAVAGTALTLATAVTCPVAAPGSAGVELRVTDAAGRTVADVSTLVYVTS